MKKKTLQIVLTILLILAGAVFAIFLRSTVGRANIETNIWTTLEIKDGECSDTDNVFELKVEKSGKYTPKVWWKEEEGEPGFVSAMKLESETGEQLFAVTGTTVDAYMEEMELNEGIYTCTLSYIESSKELAEYVRENGLISYSSDEGIYFDGLYPMEYHISLIPRNRNALMSGVIIFSSLVGLLIGLLLLVSIKNNENALGQYDERQRVIRGEGAQVALLTEGVLIGVTAVLEIAGISLPVDNALVLFTILIIGIGVYSCILIWKDAFYAINENSVKHMVILGIVIVFNSAFAVMSIVLKTAVSDGIVRISSLSFVCTIFLLVLFVLLLVKRSINKKEEEK